MSRSAEFCPRCGAAVERPAEADLPTGPGRPDAGLCDDCYFADFDLVDAPDRVEVRVCADCGAVHRGNRWVDVEARDYTDVAVEVTTEALGVHVDARDVTWAVEPEQVDENTIRMHCLFTGRVRDTPLESEVTVPVYVARETCERCGRIAGDYFAAVVQVRATDRTPTTGEVDRAEALARDVVADRGREAFVTEVTRTDDGLDLKVSDAGLGETIARRVVADLGGQVSESERLVTEDGDGNRVYRMTYLARLPPFVPGDVVVPEAGGGPVLVTSARGRLTGRRLATGERYEAEYGDGAAPAARKVGSRADAERTTLVAVEDDHAVQVLDPETYEATTVPRPDYLDPEADEVPVLRHREGLHVLPDGDADAADGAG